MMKSFKSYIPKLIDPISLLMIMCFCVLSLLFTNLKIYSLSSICFYFSLFFVFFWLVSRALIQRFKPKNKKLFYLVVISCLLFLICSLISIVRNKPAVSINLLSYVVVLVVTIISVYLTITGKFNKYIFYAIATISLLYSMILIILYLSGYARVWQSITSYTLLTLNFSNANLAGIILVYIIFIDLVGIFIFRNLYLRIFSGLVAAGCFILLIFTTARNPFIAVACAFILTLFIYFDKKKRFTTPITLLAICLPIIFIGLYFVYFKIKVPDGNIINYLDGDFGKPLTSRYFSWCNFLIASKKDAITFIFGSYSTAGNCHNFAITLQYCYGFIGLISGLGIFFLFFALIVKKNIIKHASQFLGFLFAFSFFLLGLAEATPAITSNGSFVFLLIGILLIKIPLSRSLFSELGTVNKKEGSILVISSVYGTGSIGKIVRDCHLYYLKKNINAYVAYGRGEQVGDFNAISFESPFDVLLTKIVMKLSKLQFVGSYLMTSELLKCIDDIKPRIVHITALNDQYVNPKRLLKYLNKKGIKIVYTHHSEYMYVGDCGGHAYDCETFLKNSFSCDKCTRCISRKIFNEKAKLISNFSKEDFITTSVSPWLHNRVIKSKVFNNKNDFVVTNGSSINETLLSKTKEQILAEFNINDDKDIVLHVTPSMLIKTKKSEDFIELCKLNPDMEFIIITYKANRNIDIPKNLHIVENISDPSELSSYYHAASITVLTGTLETFSMPVIESLLCGTPVLGYKCGGPESIALAEFSNFVENGDLESLNKNLKKMFNKKIDRNKIITLAKANYSSEAMAEKYMKIYNLLNKHFIVEI